MRPKDKKRAENLDTLLLAFHAGVKPLSGIMNDQQRHVLIGQIIDSLRRVEYAHFLRNEDFDAKRADPSAEIFDPLRAAVYWARKGNIDEASWLVFLFVHFGKHESDGYRLVRSIYGGLGGDVWSWSRIISNPEDFRHWIAENRGSISGRFGNHRKYESLAANSNTGVAAVIESYVKWIAPPRTHNQMIREIHKSVGQKPEEVFDVLYQSMNAVLRFGRLGKFDYLTMLGKLGVAPIAPGSAYLVGATGPLRGARLLVANDPMAKIKASDLDALLLRLDADLGVGMQVLEDSLCNWQKSPTIFKRFRG